MDTGEKQIDRMREIMDSRFFKPGTPPGELVLVIPEHKGAKRKSFRLILNHSAMGRAERVMNAFGVSGTLVARAIDGAYSQVFVCAVVAAGVAHKVNANDPESLALDEDAVSTLLDDNPGLWKYWTPILCVAVWDAYMARDVFAKDDDEASGEGEKEKGEGGSAAS